MSYSSASLVSPVSGNLDKGTVGFRLIRGFYMTGRRGTLLSVALCPHQACRLQRALLSSEGHGGVGVACLVASFLTSGLCPGVGCHVGCAPASTCAPKNH